jgi:hypothetical protein
MLYSTSEDWLDHLRSIHDLRWVCSSNDHEEEYFQDEVEYHKHVTEHHGIVANEKMLSLLSRANQAEALEAFGQCPLCALSGDEHSSDKEKAKQFVLADLVAHLRQLAVLSLVVDHVESAAGPSSVSPRNSAGGDINITASTRSSQHSDSGTDYVNEALEANKTDLAFVPSEEIYDVPPDSEVLFSAAWLQDLGEPPRFRSDYKDGSPGISDTDANEPATFETLFTPNRQTNPDREKEMKCHRLFRTSPYEQHKQRNPDPVKGTCQWFLHHPSYINWRNSVTSSLLWVSADPGCGKSVLSKFLADKELQATGSRTTCYFFFKDDSEDQNTATNALCAILHQLFNQKPELLRHAIKAFDQNKDNLTKNVDLLWNILTTTSADLQAGEIVCIFDALDECRQSELRILLQKLCSFYADCPSSSDKIALKFLVTSRPLQNIEDEFDDLGRKIRTIRLAGEDETDQIRYEINLVIEHGLTQIQHMWHLDDNAVCLLREEFAKVEHRTYLWLTLIFDLIHSNLDSVTKRGRQKIFGTIPHSVDAAYAAILNKSTDKGQARKLLQIVCAATRPLSVKEMSIAISIQAGDKAYKDLEIPSEDYSKKWIRNLCGLFVSIIDGRVYLLHETAKQFLIAHDSIQSTSSTFDGIWKHSFSMQDSNVLLAYICIWFLRLEELHSKSSSLARREIDQLVSRYNFFEYSAMNWAAHFRAAMIPEGHSLIALGLELCNVQADRYMGWEQIYWNRLGHRSSPAGLNNLHLASLLGLVRVVSQLLAAPGVDINAADEHGTTPLSWAARNGHEATVQLLLETGKVEADSNDNDSRTPIWWAARNGHESVVKLLLETGKIKADSKDNDSQTPLSGAAENGHEGVVNLLQSSTR